MADTVHMHLNTSMTAAGEMLSMGVQSSVGSNTQGRSQHFAI